MQRTKIRHVRIRPIARSRAHLTAAATGVSAGALLLAGVVGVAPAAAAQPEPDLGAARDFVVLAGEAVTNTGPSYISGSLGVSPGTAITGFPPGIVVNGNQNSANSRAANAQADATLARNDAAGRAGATAVPTDIGGLTLGPGVYNHGSGMFLTGTVTLDAKNDPAAVFIFQAGSTLITASGSRVSMINGAQPCNVFWQVGSSATLGTDTTFVGTVMALASVTVQTGTTVSGRILASTGQVSLDTNTIRSPGCDETVPDGGGGETPGGGGGSGSETPGGGGGETPGGGGETPGGVAPAGRGETPGAGTPAGRGEAPRGGGGDTPGGAGDTPDGPRIPPGHPHTGLGGRS